LGEIGREISRVREDGRENTFSLLTERRGYKEVLKQKGIRSERRRKKKRTETDEIVAELVFS
jgi:hypothetical protein